jgi:hypothetical protein
VVGLLTDVQYLVQDLLGEGQLVGLEIQLQVRRPTYIAGMYTLIGELSRMVQGIGKKNDTPVALNHVDKIVRCRIGLSDGDVDVVNPVLAQDGFDFVLIEVREWDSVGD